MSLCLYFSQLCRYVKIQLDEYERDIFFKISIAQQCWFMRFVRFVNMKLFCKSANQNKTNFRFTTLKKQTGFGKIEENMDLSRIHLAVFPDFLTSKNCRIIVFWLQRAWLRSNMQSINNYWCTVLLAWYTRHTCVYVYHSLHMYI